MQTGMSPYGNEAGLVDKFIGTAYEHVKTVADAIAQVRHVSENMQSVYDFAAVKDALQAFIDNPDFITWLEDNQENFGDLSALLNSMLLEHAKLTGANFTGFVKLGEAAPAIKQVIFSDVTPVVGASNIWEHSVNPSRIIGISGSITASNGRIETLNSESEKVQIWCDSQYLRMLVAEDATAYANRPFNVVLTITQAPSL